MSKPNIVIINPDQMRADVLSHLGNRAINTKNIDALASDGVSFSGAFCQNPVCTPSRCSFMSGWYTHVAGHRTMKHMMQPYEPVLLKELKQSGYHVWINSRNDLLPAQNKNYTKDYCDTYFFPSEIPHIELSNKWRGDPDGGNYYSFLQGKTELQRDIDQLWVEGASDFILNYNEKRPFCVFLPLYFPHPPYKIWEPYYSAVKRDELTPRILPPQNYAGKCKMMKALHEEMRLESFNDERFDELRAVYQGMCLRVDDLVGMVVRALKDKGIYDETAIFLFSDHGDYTGDYNMSEKQQNSFEDCLSNVPFVVKLPKDMQQRHGVSDELCELIDFYATAADIAGVPPTHTHFGHSLRDFMANKEENLRDAVFCEGGFREGEEQCRYSEDDNIPPKTNIYYPRVSLQMRDLKLNGKAVMCRTKKYKYIKRLYEKDELYDLEKDPGEVINEIDNPEYKDILFKMKDRLLTHLLDTGDAVPFKIDRRFDNLMIRKTLTYTAKNKLCKFTDKMKEG